MCLRVDKNSVAQVSDEDITVYKIMLRQLDGFVSPYMEYPFKYGSHTCEKFKDYAVYNNLFSFNAPVVKYGFHTLTSVQTARAVVSTFDGYDAVVVECTIPKGTKFFKGMWNHCKSYASDTLVINKIIPLNT
ncbi:hypothetical protein Xoosp13_400 [Xanthomonas phage Xoo-sp13]|nr:hypothetical protein Xoosp13_400 [Xanthomonas phage Xoo-sp13]